MSPVDHRASNGPKKMSVENKLPENKPQKVKRPIQSLKLNLPCTVFADMILMLSYCFQLYIDGELIGGLDILREMDSSGELSSMLPKNQKLEDR